MVGRYANGRSRVVGVDYTGPCMKTVLGIMVETLDES
jgi:hypothetical protein